MVDLGIRITTQYLKVDDRKGGTMTWYSQSFLILIKVSGKILHKKIGTGERIVKATPGRHFTRV